MSTELQHIQEKELFLRIAEGREDAFETLYRLYVPQLSAFLQRLSHSRAAVDEMIQETFLQLWLNRDKLPGVDHPKAWVFRIASNITCNYLKRRITEEKALGEIGRKTPAHQQDSEDLAYFNQLLNAVGEAVNQLSPQRKKVYLLSRETGLTIPEIAGQLGLSSSTVKNTLVSSLQFIREFLQEKGFYTGSFIIFLLIP